tara:strand:+ start:92 stop:256 length:165 start_codon:yes stop_codon:yes gene_type:complete
VATTQAVKIQSEDKETRDANKEMVTAALESYDVDHSDVESNGATREQEDEFICA